MRKSNRSRVDRADRREGRLDGRPLVASSSLSTVMNADKIAVIADGGVKEEGSHDELCAKGGVYAGLVRKQLTKAAAVLDQGKEDAAEAKAANDTIDKRWGNFCKVLCSLPSGSQLNITRRRSAGGGSSYGVAARMRAAPRERASQRASLTRTRERTTTVSHSSRRRCQRVRGRRMALVESKRSSRRAARRASALLQRSPHSQSTSYH